MTTNKEDIQKLNSIVEKVSEVCKRGMINRAVIPPYSLQAYNKVVQYAGGMLGWGNESKGIIDDEQIRVHAAEAFEIYKSAMAYLEAKGISRDSLLSWSPVMVISALEMNMTSPKEFIMECGRTHVYSSIALYFLALFREQAESFLFEPKDIHSKEELNSFIFAQSYLNVALDATNAAIEVSYRVHHLTIDATFDKDKAALYSKQMDLSRVLEQYHEDRAKGGSRSNAPPENFDSAFEEVLKEILGLDKDKQLSVIHVASLIRHIFLVQSPNYSIEWGERKNFKVSTYRDKVKRCGADYLSSNSGKTKTGTEKAIRKVEEYFGVKLPD